MEIRNIKFKAKRLDNGEWIVGSLIRSTAGAKERAYIVDNFSSMSDYSVVGVDPSTVCQFAGLKDCEGKEIWEGDILEHTQSHARFTVMFDRGAFFIRRNGTENTDLYLFELSEKNSCLQLFEVVGNKFDTGNSLESIYKSKKQ